MELSTMPSVHMMDRCITHKIVILHCQVQSLLELSADERMLGNGPLRV
jgi:hypothetical protein